MSIPVLVASSVVALSAIYLFYRSLLTKLTSHLRNLPGPPCSNLLWGNLLEMWNSESILDVHRSWVEKYGQTFKFRGLLLDTGVFTVDLKAVNYVYTNADVFRKSKAGTYDVRKVIGDGVLFTQGHTHKNQRRVMSPAFGSMQTQGLTPICMDKALKLRDIWLYKLESGEEVIDGFAWLGKATLDVVGEAGFGYQFNALSRDPNHKDELYDALAKMFDKFGAKSSLIPFLRGAFPTLSQWLPERQDTEARMAREVMYTIGRRLLEERKQDMSNLIGDDHRKDLLSVLVRANVSEGIPDHLRMDDESVIAQVPTFIIAGHETTSTAMSWAVYCLTQHKSIQEKLRDEILTVPTDHPSVDQLNRLPYLEAVVREALRLYAPASTTNRVAAEDVVVPLDNPIVDVMGKKHDRIKIAKGQTVVISPHLINTSKEIWGDDASEFNPERWNSIPDAAESVPGLWGNIMTFLAGPRSCIGYRFALIEMKALLFTLIRAFDIDLAVSHDDIFPKAARGITTRPALKPHLRKRYQDNLPLFVRSLARSTA